jgi:hypothetical protein
MVQGIKGPPMTRRETIYMPLLNDGTDVWAPVLAEQIGEGRYRVLGPMPEDQEWRFGPGELVKVEKRTFSGGEIGLAIVA